MENIGDFIEKFDALNDEERKLIVGQIPADKIEQIRVIKDEKTGAVSILAEFRLGVNFQEYKMQNNVNMSVSLPDLSGFPEFPGKGNAGKQTTKGPDGAN